MASYRNRVVVSVVLILILLGSGAGVSQWLVARKPDPERVDVTRPPPVVEIFQTVRADVPLNFTGYGTARADHHVSIAAEVNGQVVEVPDDINDGAFVTRGQLLLRIDDRDYQRQLDRASAQVANIHAQLNAIDIERDNVEKLVSIAAQEVDIARRELKRLSDLFEGANASSREYDLTNRTYQTARRVWQGLVSQFEQLAPRRQSLTATLAAREADVALAALNVERCRVTAPFEGQVERLVVDQGDRAQIGMELLRMMDGRHIEIPIELPASNRPFVEVNANCTLAVESMSGFSWTGNVARIAPAADALSRTFSVFVEVDNGDQPTPLTPGFFVTALVEGPVLRNVLTVPRSAIVSDSVFVAQDKNARKRSIHVTRTVGSLAVVEGELVDGDLVIVSNLDIIEDGHEIRLNVPGDSANDDQSIASSESNAKNGASR